MKQILLTGFEPFSDIKINPSEILVSDLFEELQKRNEIGVHKVIFPVDYQKADSVLKDIQFSNYDFIFQFGVAAKRSYISLERVALNWIESQIPDNSGSTNTFLGRIGSESGIARTVCFLLHDSPYITGQIIPVDGGRTAHL